MSHTICSTDGEDSQGAEVQQLENRHEEMKEVFFFLFFSLCVSGNAAQSHAAHGEN